MPHLILRASRPPGTHELLPENIYMIAYTTAAEDMGTTTPRYRSGQSITYESLPTEIRELILGLAYSTESNHEVAIRPHYKKSTKSSLTMGKEMHVKIPVTLECLFVSTQFLGEALPHFAAHTKINLNPHAVPFVNHLVSDKSKLYGSVLTTLFRFTPYIVTTSGQLSYLNNLLSNYGGAEVFANLKVIEARWQDILKLHPQDVSLLQNKLATTTSSQCRPPTSTLPSCFDASPVYTRLRLFLLACPEYQNFTVLAAKCAYEVWSMLTVWSASDNALLDLVCMFFISLAVLTTSQKLTVDVKDDDKLIELEHRH